MRNTNEATTDVSEASPVQQDDYTGITLEQAAPGLFMFNNTLHLKTEYLTDKGEIEAYVGASGEFFWGGVDNYRDRAKLIVREVDADAVAAALHSPAVAAALSNSATLVERMRQFHAEIVASDGAESGQMFMMGEAADRIAELEAELARLTPPLNSEVSPAEMEIRDGMWRAAVLAEREVCEKIVNDKRREIARIAAEDRPVSPVAVCIDIAAAIRERPAP